MFAACGRPAGSPLSFFLLTFSGILPEGLSGPAPTGGLLSCAGKKVTKEVARGPLPAPWTPGAVVPDLQPLCAFRLEPSSGLSAAWVDTRLPPPFGCCAAEGVGFEGFPLLGFSGIPPEGLSGPAPTGGTFLVQTRK